MVQTLCIAFDISHYAYDITRQCFLKHLSKNKNHEPFVYYAINNHCYLVDIKTKNEEGHNVVQSLIKKKLDLKKQKSAA